VLTRSAGHIRARILLGRALASTDLPAAVIAVEGIEAHEEGFLYVEAIRTLGSLLKRIQDPSVLPDDPVRPLYVDAARALLGGEYDRAVEGFIRVIREHRAYDEEGARRAVIAAFRLLGDEHEVTRSRRREFAGALSM
jgi:putative thioredoxin